MPRRIPEPPHWDPEKTRAQLLDLNRGTIVASGGVTADIAPVPLFRGTEGSLEQAIRVRTRAATETAGIGLSVVADGRDIDHATISAGPATEDHLLFVPEVSGDERFVVRLTVPGNDPVDTTVTVGPQRKWTVYLVHHSHFDIGYTDPQAVVMEHQLRYIDAVLGLIRTTDDWPDDAKFRWNVEVTYPLAQWLRTRTPADRDEFVRRVNEGRIEVNALPFSMHTEVYSIDELAWGFRFAEELRRDYGIEIVTAIQSDVPGATVGLLNLMTDAGIDFFSVAHNYAGRSVPFLIGGQDLTRPFWWMTADGKRVLVWQADTPHGVAYMEGVLLGLAESERLARTLLPEYLKGLAERPYPYHDQAFGWHGLPPGIEVTKAPYPHDILSLRMQNGFADNAPPSLTIAETVRDWNDQWAYPRLRMATSREFFERARDDLGDDLREFSGDWTDWWVDGVGSAALPLGLNRQAQATARTARTLTALAGEQAPAAAAGEIDRVYEDMALFDEHTWGSGNPWMTRLDAFESGERQWRRKAQFAYDAFDRAGQTLDTGLRAFTASLRPADNAAASVIVFNPSGQARTDQVRVFVPAEQVDPEAPIRLVDADGASVPFGRDPQGHPGFRAKGAWLSFAAIDVPPVGYRRYDVVSAADRNDEPGAEAPASEAADPFTLESRFYTVRVDPRAGYVASIVDRETGRELVDDTAPFGFNEYIYDRYTTAAGFNHLSGRVQATDLELFGSRSTAGHASLVSRESDGVSERLTIHLSGEGCEWIETTIALPHDVKRVDFTNRLMKVATPEKESVYFAFPFAADDPDPVYEITGGVTSKGAPHVPGSAHWMFAIRHWLAMRDDRGAIAWATYEAPLVELGTISLPYSPFPSTLPGVEERPSTVYSWALNNIWDTNFPSEQGGEMVFRYAVTSSADGTAREAGARLGASASAPLVGFALSRSGRQETPDAVSLVRVDDPLVELVGVAASRTPGALAIFLQSLADTPVATRVSFPDLPATSVRLGTFQEEDQQDVPLEDGAVTVTIEPGAYVALTVGS